jgi:ubiquinone/menaquinone biosynthesis C-methylase UbiE
MNEAPEFGNWIRGRRVMALFAASVALLAITAVAPAPWRYGVATLAMVGLATSLFLLFVYYQFDDRGGGVQRTLWRLTLDHLEAPPTGRALDVGTGNGSLALMLATEHPSLRVTGVDLWNADWAYSRDACIRNAIRCGVGDRVHFERASADALPFPDGAFDAVVSHFVFHEVASARDKRDVVREALRVLRPGGHFSFHDMFYDASLYGDAAELVEAVKSFGIESVRLVDSRVLLDVSCALLRKRVLGRCAILCGRK